MKFYGFFDDYEVVFSLMLPILLIILIQTGLYKKAEISSLQRRREYFWLPKHWLTLVVHIYVTQRFVRVSMGLVISWRRLKIPSVGPLVQRKHQLRPCNFELWHSTWIWRNSSGWKLMFRQIQMADRILASFFIDVNFMDFWFLS